MAGSDLAATMVPSRWRPHRPHVEMYHGIHRVILWSALWSMGTVVALNLSTVTHTLYFIVLLQFGKKEMRILMVGLDAAGKTTILYKLKLGEGALFVVVAHRMTGTIKRECCSLYS
jgi:ADP-ribosylation factor family